MRIKDIEGKVVREMRGETAAGLHRLNWDLGQQVAAVQRGGAPGVGGPNGGSTSEEEAERAIIDENRAADAKREAKSEGRQL